MNAIENKIKPTLSSILNRVDHAAVRLGVSRSYLYREISAGRIAIVKFGTRTLITEAELHRFAAELAQR